MPITPKADRSREYAARRARWVSLALCLASLLPAMASAANTAACNGEDTVSLSTDASGVRETRAYWLDGRHLRWPGKPATGHYRLLASAQGGLRAALGDRPAAPDLQVIALATGEADDATRSRFAFTGEGVGLQLRGDVDVRMLLRGQVLLAQLDTRGRVIDATYLQHPGALDDLYASADDGRDLGAWQASPGQAEWRLWAPTAQNATLCVYDGAGQGSALPMQREDDSGAWTASLPGRQQGRVYAYEVDVFVPGTGGVRNRVSDPYSTSVTANGVRSVLLDLQDPATQPEGWAASAQTRPAALEHQTDMVIYELHVRDFSIGDMTVPVNERGKYLAFTHQDSAGMRHLTALRKAGMTDIHLLPVFDIATVPEVGCITPEIPTAAPDSDAQQAAVMAVAARDCFNWGYDPLHYGAPEGSYASDATDPVKRVRELRAAVQGLHRAGLRVGMDVVYNHMSASGQAPHAVLDRLVPGYYQRLDEAGKVTTSTCCANTATEHRMMARLMRDTLVRWVRDYRIDSFRFDLMGHQPLEAMLRSREEVERVAGRRIPFIGEGWNFGEIADGKRFVQAAQLPLAGSGIASFSDRMRDAARGGGCCDSGEALLARQGWLTGMVGAPNGRGELPAREAQMQAADMIRIGLAGTLRDYRMQTSDGQVTPLSAIDYAGGPAGYTRQPGEVVNYVENHDNPTLFDVGVMKMPLATSASERARMQLLGAALVAFSQGVAYYHGGIDVLRSKSLDRNSFDSGDWFNRLDWRYRDNGFAAGLPPPQDNGKDWALLKPLLQAEGIKPSASDITFMRDAFLDLTQIRASTPLFRLHDAEAVQRRLRFENTGPGQDPAVIVGHLDGRGLSDAGFEQVLYFLNTSADARVMNLPEQDDKRWRLHPVQAAAAAADARVRNEARHRGGVFNIPGRSAVVFVIPSKETGR
ncbi:alpha-1,6-glucosidase domain-containing protein [Solilutibacter tolerans]|uniref:alpha-1,6-glucosidase domain-containing protein n=1 Tax=Solilutibacter tolerans TaxID=1604334 RepID=UPI0009FA8C2E|nr:alpha-1,6-glucosidase domain-containing protein [Lysobacter tolerans]